MVPGLILYNNNSEVVTHGDIFVLLCLILVIFIIISFFKMSKFLRNYKIDFFLSLFIIFNLTINYIIFKNNFVNFEIFVLISSIYTLFYFLLFNKFKTKINSLFSFIQVSIIFFLIISFLTSLLNKEYVSKIEFKNNFFEGYKLKNTPDIYHIIPDGLMSLEVLKNYEFYERNNYKNVLKKNDLILFNSMSNYPTTFASIPSMLNGSTFKENTEVSEKEFYKLNNNSSFTKMLLKNNYDVYWFENTWAGTKCINKKFICPQKKYLSNIFDNEIIIEYLKLININYSWHEKILMFLNIKKIYHLDKIQEILKKIDTKNSKYVFAHILIPHQPFKVDKQCDGTYLKNLDQKWSSEKYFIQLECLKKQIISFHNFVKDQGRPYIFIIASDTGWTFDDKLSPNINSNLKWRKEQFKNVVIINRESICFDKNKEITNAEILPNVIACSEGIDLPDIDNAKYDAYYHKTGHPDARKFVKRNF